MPDIDKDRSGVERCIAYWVLRSGQSFKSKILNACDDIIKHPREPRDGKS